MLSIIVPCYNVAHKFHALDGLTAIGDERVEVIFVDDGSTDGTGRMLEELELRPAKKVMRSPGVGPGAARNLGLSGATRDYIWFVDADDRAMPEPVLARMPEVLRTMPDVALFQGVCAGQQLPSRWSDSSDMRERFAGYGRPSTKLFKREFLERNAIRFADSYASEDNAFVLQAAELQSSSLAYDETIYEVILTDDSICRGSFNPAYISRWRAVKDMLDFARTHPRRGLRELEREMVFLSLSLTWIYYAERGRLRNLLPLMPRMLASLRKWKLLQHLDVFLASGSAANRAAKLAAVSAALPLSYVVGGMD